MKIYFIRHGQIEGNLQNLMIGDTDMPLNEKGREQVREARKNLPKSLTAIYSSDLVRCRETAEILNEELNLPIFHDARLRESHFGSMEGKNVKEMDPNAEKRKDRIEQRYDYRPWGGESAEDVRARFIESINEMKEKHPSGEILVVTHGGIVRLAHVIFNNQFPELIKNASVHEFEFPDK